jgi:Helix-turn-helix domain
MSYKDGLCFPSYETIAERARCCRDTVYEAIIALEATGIFSWVNRIDRVVERGKDLFGLWVTSYRIARRRSPLPHFQRSARVSAHRSSFFTTEQAGEIDVGHLRRWRLRCCAECRRRGRGIRRYLVAWRLCEACLDVEAASIMLFE